MPDPTDSIEVQMMTGEIEEGEEREEEEDFSSSNLDL